MSTREELEHELVETVTNRLHDCFDKGLLLTSRDDVVVMVDRMLAFVKIEPEYHRFTEMLVKGAVVRLASAHLAGDELDMVAARMIAAVPSAHAYEELGPYYDTAGLTTWRGVSRQSLYQQATKRRLLACPTGSGKTVYPAWQFTTTGAVLPALIPVLDVLLAATDPWTVATWLATPAEDGTRAVDLLGTPDGAQQVLAEAREDAARWAA